MPLATVVAAVTGVTVPEISFVLALAGFVSVVGTPKFAGANVLPITGAGSIASAAGISEMTDVWFSELLANPNASSLIVNGSAGARSELFEAGLLEKRAAPQATTSVAEAAINPTETKNTGSIECLRLASKNSTPIVNKLKPAASRMSGHINSMPANARICTLASVKTVMLQISSSTAHFPNRYCFFEI